MIIFSLDSKEDRKDDRFPETDTTLLPGKNKGDLHTVQRISIAPMIDVTDRHFRYFARLLTKKSMLYTEMITSSAILHGDRKKLLDFSPLEKPITLQIAGSDPKEIAEAIQIAEAWDYDEINLNAGCPSDRVSGNEMGAALMAYPDLVAEILAEARKVTKKPVTVKSRIGIDGTHVLPETLDRVILDKYEDLHHFVKLLSDTGTDHFVIHARIAILAGLSPKDNREIPPLRYEDVYRIKEAFPHLFIEINGGIRRVEEIRKQLEKVDGVMIGRAAYEDAYILSKLDALLPGETLPAPTRREVIENFIPYVEQFGEDRRTAHHALKNTLGLFHEKPGSRLWRQLVSSSLHPETSAKEVLEKALRELPSESLDAVL